MIESDLELALRGLGDRLRSEPTADLATAVAARLVAPTPVRSRRRLRLAFALAAALLVLSGVAVAATPRLLDAVRDWLGMAGVEVELVDALPPTVPLTAIPGLGLGEPVTAVEAARLLDTPLPVSPVLGPPDRVFALTSTDGPVMTLLWRSRDRVPAVAATPAVGALLTIAPAGDRDDVVRFGKSFGPGTHAVFVDLDTAVAGQGVWIEGAPHAVTLPDGRRETFRLASNVLLWLEDRKTFRLETALGKDDAVRIATTLRVGGSGSGA